MRFQYELYKGEEVVLTEFFVRCEPCEDLTNANIMKDIDPTDAMTITHPPHWLRNFQISEESMLPAWAVDDDSPAVHESTDSEANL